MRKPRIRMRRNSGGVWRVAAIVRCAAVNGSEACPPSIRAASVSSGIPCSQALTLTTRYDGHYCLIPALLSAGVVVVTILASTHRRRRVALPPGHPSDGGVVGRAP